MANDEFSTNMKIIAGVNVQRDEQKRELADADKKKLSSAYFQLFYNLTFANWLRGGNLGTAWYRALAQMQQFVNSKSAKNPAGLYLRQVLSAHKARWAQVMMTSPHRNDVISASPEKIQQWNQRVARATTQAMNGLNTTLAQYEKNVPHTTTNVTNAQGTDAYKIAMQKMQQMIILEIQKRQNGMVA